MELFLTIKVINNANDSNTFVFTKKLKEIIKEILEIRSIDGINIAGKTSKLDNVYITLLRLSQEDIFKTKCKYIYL